MAPALNRVCDRIPRSHISVGARAAPAFRLLGTLGFYAACLQAAAAAMLAGRSLAITAILVAISAVSFYAYALFRRWLTGRESLVLLEHVWFTLACCAGFLALSRQSVLPHLDTIAPPLALFLAFGRVGCLLTGCCHGHPAAIGIVYAGDELFAGVRLFPAQALECAGLLAISISGLAALPFTRTGTVVAWSLVAYGVMRIGLESLRGDRRPNWWGLSQAQWMSLAQIVAAVFLAERGDLRVLAFAPAVLVAVAARWFRSARRRLLQRSHLDELRGHVAALAEAVLGSGAVHPALHMTRAGAAIAVSWAGASLPGAAHVSLSHSGANGDLLLLCEMAAAAFPDLFADSTRATASRVLHFATPAPPPSTFLSSGAAERLGRRVYARLFRITGREAAVRVEVSPPAWFFNAGKGS